ncbi:Protein of unknown function [Ruminococcaceae bacterium YRB3002]|nr:Protein of unknown function [Ruminococcaceae bacterium YRB3002]
MKCVAKQKRLRPLVIKIVILLIILAAVVFVPRLLPGGAVDFYCEHIFPALSLPGVIINSMFMTSLTEMFVVTGSVILLLLTVAGIVVFTGKLFGKFGGGARIFAAAVIKNILVTAVIAGIIFQLMHGISYRRTPAYDRLGTDNSDYSIEAYEEALRWAYYNMISARQKLGEDYNGVAHSSYTYESTVQHANALIDMFSDDYDLGMSGNYVRGKAVSLSRYWSLTHIVGVYDAFLVEANINTGYMDITSFDMTVCHELCHAKGYADETSCNIIAALACTRSVRPDFRYAGYYYIFWDLYEVIYNNAVLNDGEIPSFIDPTLMYPVYRDMAARNAYWDKIDSMFMSEEIVEISENTNDAFLRANGSEGTSSYNVPENVYLDYYMTYIKDRSQENT